MTKRVLKFKRQPKGGWYESRQMTLCGSIVQYYLDVEEAFDLHFSTRRPTDDDEFYVLEGMPQTSRHWYLMEGPDAGDSPTTSQMDYWLTKHFAGERVYVWAVG